MSITQLPRAFQNVSKAELQLVLNAILEGLCGLDAEGNVTFCNNTFQKMTGYRHEEIIGTSLQELLHRGRPAAENGGEETSSSHATFNAQPIHRVGEIYWQKDGTRFPTEYWSNPLERPLRLTESVATILDITERKRAEEKILFEAALLEAQTETTLDGILVVDGAGKVIRTNQQFRLMFAVPIEVLLSVDDSILLQHVTATVENPDGFRARVEYLYGHPEEKSRDEINLRDGKLFDRYSAP